MRKSPTHRIFAHVSALYPFNSERTTRTQAGPIHSRRPCNPPTGSPRPQGFTPLHVAIQLRNLDVVKVLIEQRADLEARDKASTTKLQNARLIPPFNTAALRDTSGQIRWRFKPAGQNDTIEDSLTI